MASTWPTFESRCFRKRKDRFKFSEPRSGQLKNYKPAILIIISMMGSWKYWWQNIFNFFVCAQKLFSFCPVSFQVLFYSFLSSKSAKEPLVGWPHPKSSRCWSEPLGRIRWRVFWRWLAQRWWMKWAMNSCLTTAKECNQFSPSYSSRDSRHTANVFANDGSWLRFRSPVITIIWGSRWNTAHEASTAMRSFAK